MYMLGKKNQGFCEELTSTKPGISGFLSHTKTGYFGAKITKKKTPFQSQACWTDSSQELYLPPIVSEPKNEGLEDDFPFQVGDS